MRQKDDGKDDENGGEQDLADGPTAAAGGLDASEMAAESDVERLDECVGDINKADDDQAFERRVAGRIPTRRGAVGLREENKERKFSRDEEKRFEDDHAGENGDRRERDGEEGAENEPGEVHKIDFSMFRARKIKKD